MYPKIFWGALFRSLRLQHGIAQKEIAEVLHISRQEVSDLERGRRHPSPELIHSLSSIYDMDLMTYIDDCIPEEYQTEQGIFRKKLLEKNGPKTSQKEREPHASTVYYQKNDTDPVELVREHTRFKREKENE